MTKNRPGPSSTIYQVTIRVFVVYQEQETADIDVRMHEIQRAIIRVHEDLCSTDPNFKKGLDELDMYFVPVTQSGSFVH